MLFETRECELRNAEVLSEQERGEGRRGKSKRQKDQRLAAFAKVLRKLRERVTRPAFGSPAGQARRLTFNHIRDSRMGD